MLDPYIKINEMTANYIAEFDEYTLDDLEFIKGLNKIVLAHDFSLRTKKFKTHMNLNTSYKYAYDFLGSMKGSYADYLKKAWHNNVFHFKSGRIPSKASSSLNVETGEREIIFPVCHTIEDSYAITHEIMHDYNMDVNNHTITRSLLTETISICAEMLQEDYLGNLKKVPCDYKNNMINDMIAIFYKAVSVDYQMAIIGKFLLANIISQDDFSNITYMKSRRDIRIGNEAFNDMIEAGELNFDTEQRYIIGILLASLLHQQIIADASKLQSFIYLNDHINEMELNDVFKLLGLELTSKNGDILKVADKSLDILEKNYVKELKRFR